MYHKGEALVREYRQPKDRNVATGIVISGKQCEMRLNSDEFLVFTDETATSVVPAAVRTAMADVAANVQLPFEMWDIDMVGSVDMREH